MSNIISEFEQVHSIIFQADKWHSNKEVFSGKQLRNAKLDIIVLAILDNDKFYRVTNFQELSQFFFFLFLN